MIYSFSALAIILLVLGVAALRRISLYSPLVISASMWLLVFGSGIAFQDRLYPLTDDAFLAWLIWFLVTSALYFILSPVGVVAESKCFVRRLSWDYSFFLLILLIWLIWRIWVVGSTGPEHFFLNLRLSSNQLEGFEPLGMVERFYPLVFALFVFEHIYSRRENRYLRILCWAWMLAYAVATMGKFAILTPILSWVVICGLQNRLPLKKLFVLVLVTFFLMLLAHFVRAGSEDESTVLDILAIYVYSPLVALGYMSVDQAEIWGGYVFRFFYALGYSVGLLPKPAEVILSYVSIPELTNVYTVMQPFFQDFGLPGVFCGAVFYGFFFSVLYGLARRGSDFCLAGYSLISIVLLGQFIGELLLTTLSQHLQELLALILVFMGSRKIIRVS